jgi:hypothetical protein
MAVAAAAGSCAARGATPARHLSLGRLPVAWLDRVLPEHSGPFLAVVATVSAVCWLAGLLLADDRARFLASREWQVQPLYLAVHLVVVRLFVTAYAGGFLCGCEALDIATAAARRAAHLVLGPAGFCAALLLAAPLALLDVNYVAGAQFESATTSGAAAVGAADWLLVSMWTVEWIANAYVWVVIGGFLIASMRVLGRHAFRDPVIQVLRERQYRPFLLMSSRGATIVLVFTAASALYVLYTKGETTDYVGLWVTAGLLLGAFVPPWMRLRSRISALVRTETDRLGVEVESAIEKDCDSPSGAASPRTIEAIGERVQMAFALLRIEHLERLHADMGKSEAQAVLLRLLAPMATIAWRLVRGGA